MSSCLNLPVHFKFSMIYCVFVKLNLYSNTIQKSKRPRLATWYDITAARSIDMWYGHQHVFVQYVTVQYSCSQCRRFTDKQFNCHFQHDNWQMVCNVSIETDSMYVQGGAKKRGHRPSYLIANIPKTPWPNCMKIGELLQYYMLNTVINFLFKNFIALWRHLAKTPRSHCTNRF